MRISDWSSDVCSSDLPVPEPVCWWAPDFSRRIRASESEAAEHLVHLMRAAVTDRMVADVPLGAFLSGGVDSSAVVALMAEASAKAVKTCTIGFDQAALDETASARQIAEDRESGEEGKGVAGQVD